MGETRVVARLTAHGLSRLPGLQSHTVLAAPAALGTAARPARARTASRIRRTRRVTGGHSNRGRAHGVALRSVTGTLCSRWGPCPGGHRRTMARFALLVVLVSALAAAAPAQADVLPVDLPATAATAGTTVQQAPADAVTVVRRTITTAAPVAKSVEPAVKGAAAAAQPAVDAVAVAATTAPVVSGPPRREGRLRAASSSTGPAESASFHRPAAPEAGSGRAHPPARPARPRRATAPAARGAAVDQPQHPASRGDQPAPDQGPSSVGSGTASAAAAGFFFGGAALLAGAFCLAGPPLRRRLSIRPAVFRPVAFVSLLERPG